jgi:hypothetical protein
MEGRGEERRGRGRGGKRGRGGERIGPNFEYLHPNGVQILNTLPNFDPPYTDGGLHREKIEGEE